MMTAPLAGPFGLAYGGKWALPPTEDEINRYAFDHIERHREKLVKQLSHEEVKLHRLSDELRKKQTESLSLRDAHADPKKAEKIERKREVLQRRLSQQEEKIHKLEREKSVQEEELATFPEEWRHQREKPDRRQSVSHPSKPRRDSILEAFRRKMSL